MKKKCIHIILSVLECCKLNASSVAVHGGRNAVPVPVDGHIWTSLRFARSHWRLEGREHLENSLGIEGTSDTLLYLSETDSFRTSGIAGDSIALR